MGIRPDDVQYIELYNEYNKLQTNGEKVSRPPQPAAGAPEHLPREIAAPRSVAAALQGSVTTPE